MNGVDGQSSVRKYGWRTHAAVITLGFLFIGNLILPLFFFQIPTTPIKMSEPGLKRGVIFTDTMVKLTEHELDHWWLVNAYFSGNALLDNRPNFQLGVREVILDTALKLREDLSRLRTTDQKNEDLEKTFSLYSIDPYKFMFPRAEWEYAKAIGRLEQYKAELNIGKAHFHSRSDNLIKLLELYVSLMGKSNTALITAAPDIRFIPSEETAGDPVTKEETSYMEADVSWFETDDRYYHAKGVAWGLLHMFRAIKVDFKHVLVDKNSLELIDSITYQLERCVSYDPVVVMNGAPDGIFANHLLGLSGPFNDARQKTNSLISALTTG